MDSQVTATVQTTLNEPLERYKQLYSEYLSMIIEIHNYHTQFLKFQKVRARDGLKLRNVIKKMRDLQMDLWRACNEAEQSHWILNPPVRGARRKDITKRPRRKKKKINDMAVSKSNSGGTT
jgi:hypothetical protein